MDFGKQNREAAFETLDQMKYRHWWVRLMADEFLRVIPSYVKGENLIYLSAILKLVVSDPDGFFRHGSELGHVRFYGHERKGKSNKLVAVKARWVS